LIIVRLRLFQYRNLKEPDIELGPGTTLFSGRNGQGKTNVLEAIYFLAYGRSFRTSTPKDCIRHGGDCCRIEGFVERGDLCRELAVTIDGKEKKLMLMGKSVPLDEFVGNLHLLAFTHEHLGVVRGSPADRRAFLDRAMVSLYPGHVGNLATYGRALRQRNNVLGAIRDGKMAFDGALLDSWDEAVVRPGARILSSRLKYVEKMKQYLPHGLFGAQEAKEELRMHYLATVEGDSADVPDLEERLRKKLWDARGKDRAAGYTSIGPHRDELKLYVNGKSLVDFGSAGQQRSALLSLYFSQMEIHFNAHGFYPVFLVDDAEAELDGERLRTFLQYLSCRTQTILTSAKDFLIDSMPEGTVRYEVGNGEVFPGRV
jgi:DNA replication and repair protein RecF